MKQLPWTLCVLALALVAWLALAVVSVENQRNALVTKACVDPAFKNEVDAKCLASVQSRERVLAANSKAKDRITELQDFVRTRLSAHEYPREISFIDEMPMTTTGKVIRRILRDRG